MPSLYGKVVSVDLHNLVIQAAVVQGPLIRDVTALHHLSERTECVPVNAQKSGKHAISRCVTQTWCAQPQGVS